MGKRILYSRENKTDARPSGHTSKVDMLQKIESILSRYSWFFALLVFCGINLWFNYYLFWHNLVFDNSTIGSVWGEVRVFEWLTDKFYRTILAGGNPFGAVSGMLYPFKIHLGLTDAGNGIFYLFLRPFFSPYQSLMVIMAISQLLANIGMYLLLRKLQFEKSISFILALAYGYMTFLMPRGGHLNYWPVYTFPWFYYSCILVIKNRKILQKVLGTLGASFFFVLTLWINFYYFVILSISVVGLFVSFFIVQRKNVIQKIVELNKYILFGVISIFILLVPWGIALYTTVLFDEIPKTGGWGGAIEFSSDLFGFFIPNQYNNYIYRYFSTLYTEVVTRFAPFAVGIFENYTYPGIIILGSYLLYLIFLTKKSFKATNARLIPYFLTSMIFLILTLGPFLHVFGHWRLYIGEGIFLSVPLPYVLFQKLPFMGNIRVPGRLIVGFIFFAYIVSAYIINFFLQHKSFRFRHIFFAILIVIFLFDQRHLHNLPPPEEKFPYKIFESIKKDTSHVSVLEIPFTVRDGFTYFGDGNAVTSIVGEAHHGKPILGGYTGRIADYKKSYYINNPFFGYLGRIIDGDIEKNPTIEKKEVPNYDSIDKTIWRDVIDFLDVKYIITNDTMPYIASVSAHLIDTGYTKVKQDDSFSLYQTTISDREFLFIDMSDENAVTYLGMGWYEKEKDCRWSKKKSSVMFKISRKKPFKLHLEAASLEKSNSLAVYLNQKKQKKILITDRLKEYEIPLDPEDLVKGINTVHFMFDTSSSPSKLIPGNTDNRGISAYFKTLILEDSSL
ncbi:hypothetical protein A3G65_01475 [Candidatus Roizmanbacteria bacterium RIFCSPLOWO2_12_FULL_37_7b]|nr:MAG: hypothetical protein A3E10_01840 [Candidatus Roizmanbacteria bacterium RIFCSPHIGHO2_12_FULL_37_23]OGK60396.1 MAG: hypothetical protein A3G65_01475 [Candidatus Roizmanbacteria bacterium RIFCSPLOWO2_12_FULL_37_7b]